MLHCVTILWWCVVTHQYDGWSSPCGCLIHPSTSIEIKSHLKSEKGCLTFFSLSIFAVLSIWDWKWKHWNVKAAVFARFPTWLIIKYRVSHKRICFLEISSPLLKTKDAEIRTWTCRLSQGAREGTCDLIACCPIDWKGRHLWPIGSCWWIEREVTWVIWCWEEWTRKEGG